MNNRKFIILNSLLLILYWVLEHMKKTRKYARDFLKKCNLATYLDVVKSAKLTPRQKAILGKHIINDETVLSISLGLNISEHTAERYLTQAYDRIYEEIQKKSGINENACSVIMMEGKK